MMIRLDKISFGYPERDLGRNVRTILSDYSLEIPDGARICLSAPSGKGKSTVLRLIMGLEKPDSGIVNGTDGLSFSCVFQDSRLLPWKTVLENVSMFSDSDSARDMLGRLGLSDSADKYPDELSGGMNRRVCLARALCHQFDVLILDEAFTGLDEGIKNDCLRITDGCIGKKTLVMTSHDLSDAAALKAVVVANL